MTLGLETAVSELLAWGLVDRRAIVDGDLRLSSAARRNRNLRLERRGGTGYLIKQPEPGTTAARTLEAEARFYEICRRDPRLAAVARRMARHHPLPAAEPALVLELVAGGRSLWQELRARCDGGLPLELARSLGEALATVHGVFRSCPLEDLPELAALGAAAPWAFRLHRPRLAALRRLSPAKRQILRTVQGEPELAGALDAAAAEWRAATVIHGDLRADNVLVAGGENGEPPTVLLIDWELVQRGDPAWDVAGACQDLVLFWLLGMPQAPELAPEARVAQAEVPLAAVQAALRALWGGYAGAGGGEGAGAGEASGGMGTEEAGALLRRTVRYAGVRMLQTAWEYGSKRRRLPSVAVLLLQIAANVLRDADAARADLFGLAAGR